MNGAGNPWLAERQESGRPHVPKGRGSQRCKEIWAGGLIRDAHGVIREQAKKGLWSVLRPRPGRGVRVPSAQRLPGHAFHHCINWHCPRTRLQS